MVVVVVMVIQQGWHRRVKMITPIFCSATAEKSQAKKFKMTSICSYLGGDEKGEHRGLKPHHRLAVSSGWCAVRSTGRQLMTREKMWSHRKSGKGGKPSWNRECCWVELWARSLHSSGNVRWPRLHLWKGSRNCRVTTATEDTHTHTHSLTDRALIDLIVSFIHTLTHTTSAARWFLLFSNSSSSSTWPSSLSLYS